MWLKYHIEDIWRNNKICIYVLIKSTTDRISRWNSVPFLEHIHVIVLRQFFLSHYEQGMHSLCTGHVVRIGYCLS